LTTSYSLTPASAWAFVGPLRRSVYPGFGEKADDPDLSGSQIRLENWNISPLRIRRKKGMPICQSLFDEVHGIPEAAPAASSQPRTDLNRNPSRSLEASRFPIRSLLDLRSDHKSKPIRTSGVVPQARGERPTEPLTCGTQA
jgi:hypothetical protein